MSNNWKWVRMLLLFLLCFAMQTTVAQWLSIFGAGPDFVVIMIVSIAITYGPAAGVLWGFLAGFTQDIYAPVEWLGANMISYTVLGFLVGQLEERFLTLNMPAKVGVLGFGFFLCDMLYFFLTGLEKDVVTNLFFSKTLPECAYTMVVGAVVFHLSIGKKRKHV
ncbi:rod shape-determining protein MreD [Fibrobacter sp. UWR2]|uniref:rod shape-determining protein MreD n=1 Tax=Fibrobacter sp. UWR2 TaxID=1964352 RepID=UPI000B51ED50|nr:rod shape-determining protein MreD [Fibrobacter sp. UWR2]OWV00682.1 rod shape-determining protein MreD [Fibrobacter sp. UWR2]